MHLLRDVPPWKDVLGDSSFKVLGVGSRLLRDSKAHPKAHCDAHSKAHYEANSSTH